MSSADKVFEALASVTRRRILAYIAEAPLSAGDIAARFEMSQPAVSKHLAVLEGAGWRVLGGGCQVGGVSGGDCHRVVLEP